MRAVLLASLLVLAVVGCGGHSSTSTPKPRLYATTGSTGESPGGAQAGGPPTLVRHGGQLVGKGLLVVAVHGDDLVVANPGGGRLTLAHREPAGATSGIHVGDHLSFVGRRTGAVVTVSSLSAIQR